MNLLSMLYFVNYILAVPTAFLLLIVALYFTIRFRGIQFRSLPRFFHLIKYGIATGNDRVATVNPFYALFSAMSTSIGMGTIVGPSVAIIMGGPGALFWLLFYAMCAATIKFVEVSLAVYFREKTNSGQLIGGPMQYMAHVKPFLGTWYAIVMLFLFAGWSALQANVLADILAQEFVPHWITGIILALLVSLMLAGGANRIGSFNSKLVPCMFLLYVTIALIIIISHWHMLFPIAKLIMSTIFSPGAMVGGILGSSIFAALCAGIYKGAFITEAGMGTSSIPHALADVKNPTDQGILAMMSVFVDTFLCLLSGLLVLVTDVWRVDCVNNTLIYRVFQSNFPVIGQPVLIVSIIMFVTGTVIGNSFNGKQSFASLTRYRWTSFYSFFVCAVIFLGAISNVPLVWAIMEFMIPFVAIPHVISLLYLDIYHVKVLRS